MENVSCQPYCQSPHYADNSIFLDRGSPSFFCRGNDPALTHSFSVMSVGCKTIY
uniref:Uncharacterized protein n=1 Tax=Anguilla anguilla TaxID=7936 RepID=A0A0E9RKB8_ANGAN